MAQDVPDYRLGLRRNVRDYSITNRMNGKNAWDRLQELAIRSGLDFTLVMWMMLLMDDDDDLPEDEEDILLLSVLLIGEALAEINTPYLSRPDPIPPGQVTLASFSDQQFYSLTGFTRPQAVELAAAIELPDHFVIGEGTRAYNALGEHVFVWSLSRIRSCYNKLILHQEQFYAHYSSLSRFLLVRMPR